ncbi:MAG: family 14 glycosylhydrolase [Magnetococcales bacterium]|nr:family 14 glycosylhydrolase [Magnetococcales bacterium]
MLKDNEWDAFKKRLHQAKEIGVEAVTVDMWWGHVMKIYGQQDWDYYKALFNVITLHGLDIVPIFSLHHGGGSVGDGDLDVPIPPWVYSKLSKDVGLQPDDLRYMSEKGRLHSDAIPVWATTGESHGPKVVKVMGDFFQAFTEVEYFRKLAEKNCFPEFNISLGPTGELRYPSYNEKRPPQFETTDEWEYPHRGFFQCYSSLAQNSFQKWVIEKWRNLKQFDPAAANDHWVKQYYDPDRDSPPFLKILPPGGEKSPDNHEARADDFVSGRVWLIGNQKDREYAQDFLSWYHESLLKHGQALLEEANSRLSGEIFGKIPLGMKIPGVHWQWRCTNVTRMAEMTAGLIPPLPEVIYEKKGKHSPQEADVPMDMAWLEDGHYPIMTGYENIFNMVRAR